MVNRRDFNPGDALRVRVKEVRQVDGMSIRLKFNWKERMVRRIAERKERSRI